jgi:uncharacterized protein YijF (DUF1287 family)
LFEKQIKLIVLKENNSFLTFKAKLIPMRQKVNRYKFMTKALIFIVFFMLTICSAIGQTSFYNQLADSAFVLINERVQYDPSYFRIDYPNGDIPKNKGVCTDVIIRAYRKLGIDLQKEVHEDMAANFDKYPKKWGLNHPDKNIDHRRVPNLMTFFTRKGTIKQISQASKEYQPGDIVCWDLGGGITHIGIVSRKKTHAGQRYLIIHNIGAGHILEDCLFKYKIIGHYKFEK